MQDAVAVETIRAALYATTGKKVGKRVQALAIEHASLALSHEHYPAAGFALLLEILTVDALFNKRGIEYFLVNLAADMHQLSLAQRQALLQVAGENYPRYTYLDGCWVLGDLIARHYEKSQAMAFFKQVFRSASAEGREGVALGLDVIARHAKRDPGVVREVQRILRSAP